MNRIPEPDAELSWLNPWAGPESYTGYDAGGWEASTWILHAMYENPDLPADVTHDEAHRARLAAGLAEPTIVNGVDLDERTTLTGIPLGFEARPAPAWRRVRWSDYATRGGRLLGGGQAVPPCHRWFPSSTWPVSMLPPPEGSLDEESLGALLPVLAGHSSGGGETPCVAFYTPLATGDWTSPRLMSGPLRSIRDLVLGENALQRHGVRSTPSNFWPRDRSWFVWTDWDLQGTKVSGSAALITAVRAEPDLETITWPPGSE